MCDIDEMKVVATWGSCSYSVESVSFSVWQCLATVLALALDSSCCADFFWFPPGLRVRFCIRLRPSLRQYLSVSSSDYYRLITADDSQVHPYFP